MNDSQKHRIPISSLKISLCALICASGLATYATDVGQLSRSLEKKPISFQTTSSRIEGETRAMSGASSEQPAHRVNKIRVEGNTVFSAEELEPLYSDMIGKSLTFEDLQSIARLITERYLKAGYVLSSAILPKQDITHGEVTFHVIEGYVDKISVEDPHHELNERIQILLDKILDSKPLHKDVLEKNIMVIQRLAGIQINLFFKPSKEHKNASELVVKLDRRMIEGSASANNDGVNSIGPWRGTLQGRINNLTTNDDYLDVSGITTENTKDLRAGFLTYMLPIGLDGLKVLLSGNVLKTKPSGDLESQDIRSKGNGAQLAVEYPILLERDQLLTVTGGASFSNSISDSPIGTSYYRDKFRSLVASVNYELSDSWMGSNLAQLSFEYGLKGLGSTSTPGTNRSTARGTANFLTTNLTYSRLQHLEKWVPNTSLFFIAQGQLSNATLLSSKQFGIGGAPYNRAYLPYAVTGDSGFQGRLEARYTQDLNSEFFKNWMAYGYYTYGKAWNRSPSAEESSAATAQGVGAGVRFLLHKSAVWYVEYGRPLRDVINGSSNKDKWYTGISYYF